MVYSDRIELYKKIEKTRKRPLIVYITSSRQNGGGRMGSDVIPEFCEQIAKIPKDIDQIDLLVVSQGGDPLVSWRIVSLLRERFENVGVLLPFQAYSAATLLALGADEIIMHPFSNLGPVDPQLHVEKNIEGKPNNLDFAAEDLFHFLDFVRDDVGITNQEQKEQAFELLCKDAGTLPIGAAKRNSNLSLSLGQKLLALHMEDDEKVESITKILTKSFYHHGYPVGRAEAIKLGLPIVDSSNDVEEYIWEVWKDFETEMKCKEPFNPLNVISQDPELSKQIETVPKVNIPMNLPPHVMAQMFQKIINNIQPAYTKSIEYEIFNASVESIRIRSKYKTKYSISAMRMPDMNININVATISQGWKTINTPK